MVGVLDEPFVVQLVKRKDNPRRCQFRAILLLNYIFFEVTLNPGKSVEAQKRKKLSDRKVEVVKLFVVVIHTPLRNSTLFEHPYNADNVIQKVYKFHLS
jgi:hypothetical protein